MENYEPMGKNLNMKLSKESVLEIIASSQTRMGENRSENKNGIDNCLCPPCVCLPYTSPGGNATAYCVNAGVSVVAR
jgi:hypothetical protein